MQAFEVRFHSELRELIRQERIKEAQHLCDGKASDYAEYRERVGIMIGLERARQLSDQLLKKESGASTALEQMLTTQHEREPWQHS